MMVRKSRQSAERHIKMAPYERTTIRTKAPRNNGTLPQAATPVYVLTFGDSYRKES